MRASWYRPVSTHAICSCGRRRPSHAHTSSKNPSTKSSLLPLHTLSLSLFSSSAPLSPSLFFSPFIYFFLFPFRFPLPKRKRLNSFALPFWSEYHALLPISSINTFHWKSQFKSIERKLFSLFLFATRLFHSHFMETFKMFPFSPVDILSIIWQFSFSFHLFKPIDIGGAIGCYSAGTPTCDQCCLQERSSPSGFVSLCFYLPIRQKLADFPCFICDPKRLILSLKDEAAFGDAMRKMGEPRKMRVKKSRPQHIPSALVELMDHLMRDVISYFSHFILSIFILFKTIFRMWYLATCLTCNRIRRLKLPLTSCWRRFSRKITLTWANQLLVIFLFCNFMDLLTSLLECILFSLYFYFLNMKDPLIPHEYIEVFVSTCRFHFHFSFSAFRSLWRFLLKTFAWRVWRERCCWFRHSISMLFLVLFRW